MEEVLQTKQASFVRFNVFVRSEDACFSTRTAQKSLTDVRITWIRSVEKQRINASVTQMTFKTLSFTMSSLKVKGASLILKDGDRIYLINPMTAYRIASRAASQAVDKEDWNARDPGFDSGGGGGRPFLT